MFGWIRMYLENDKQEIDRSSSVPRSMWVPAGTGFLGPCGSQREQVSLVHVVSTLYSRNRVPWSIWCLY
jgi:hypothetical protein